MSARFRLDALAERFALELRGDPAQEITGVATLACAEPHQLGFLANPSYRKQLTESRAGAVVLGAGDAEGYEGNALISRNPYADFARVAALFEQRSPARPGIHPTASVDVEARVDPGAEIGPQVSIGARSRIAAGVRIGPGCVIGEDCEIGEGCELVARVTLVARVRLGVRVLVHPGVVLGADGFGLAFDDGHWLKVPQLGGVRIGDDCEIGANTCIDRGALDDTVLEEDVRLDNLIQVGHNVHIGAHTAIAGCTAIAGSTRIGRYCLIAGGVGIAGHLNIGDRVRINAMALVSRSLEGPGEYASGTPIQTARAWRRSAARFRQLDQLARAISKQNKDLPDD
ncbi:UDP-3-O-(3-hydroxymyristoyl)glucosamine N-acyltransferase [Pseudomarimonas salicorniae]|uniref:UDP-3-O-acylglucosamine N-acyltransferase n=1 Tax=Pseudomarimonas salicorniae TaxID=2933270 RepID=A0ABT0GDK1_9GAMM|nr:UDP-3-O-(3-hydroxymyristoyl)glucosamine N-acyltransferase [Lysobacter sp. CAU 1642]MCK7592625.1 UDP-3-O-(3-hydroxymyristoyl)glucosamine N-acyltransferase [Lysobacter sp. CAU 1642]